MTVTREHLMKYLLYYNMFIVCSGTVIFGIRAASYIDDCNGINFIHDRNSHNAIICYWLFHPIM